MARRLNAILNSQEKVLESHSYRNGYRLGRSYAEINAIYTAANGLCAICETPRGKRNHALDHDHATGKLRGVLCSKCNQGLGHFNDDISLMQKAIEYLKRYGQK